MAEIIFLELNFKDWVITFATALSFLCVCIAEVLFFMLGRFIVDWYVEHRVVLKSGGGLDII